jgi:HAD superfamily hydrolase (TIGR01450 family)
MSDNISTVPFREWFVENEETYDALIFDVDGVLVLNEEALPGAYELISTLREKSFPFKLLTNDGNNSIREKKGLIEAAGLDIREEEITSAAHALEEVVREKGLTGRLFFVMGKLGDPCYAENAGVTVTRKVEDLRSCCGVIVGEEGYNWEPVVNGVINFFISNPQAPLIVPNPDLYFPAAGGEIRVAAGGVARFMKFLLSEYGLSINPLFLGKPNYPIFRHSHNRLEDLCGRQLDKERILILGDSLTADIDGARKFGYKSALMLTGLTTEKMLAESSIRPDFVFRGL